MERQISRLEIEKRKLVKQKDALALNLRKSEKLFRQALDVKMQYEALIAKLYSDMSIHKKVKQHLDSFDIVSGQASQDKK